MQFDARRNRNPEAKKEFLSWLVSTTAQDLQRSSGNDEQIRTAVFLYLHRAYEAHLDADVIVDLLGVGPESIMSIAGLTQQDERSVMDWYEKLDPTVCNVYS